MNKKTKLFLLVAGVALQVFIIYQIGSMLAPGSFPSAETYELNASEEDVKFAIKKFKEQHPEYDTPGTTINNHGYFELTDHQSENPDHWFIVYFYYPNENQILYTWTRPVDIGKTKFAFVRINNGLDLGNWKDINRDYGFFENREIKKQFEERILNPIQLLLPKSGSR